MLSLQIVVSHAANTSACVAIYVTIKNKKQACLSLHVECLVFLFDTNHRWNYSTDYNPPPPPIKFLENPHSLSRVDDMGSRESAQNRTNFCIRLCLIFNNAVVLPYPLIQYPRFTANRRQWKIKEINGS
jgi:hypothetical protein